MRATGQLLSDAQKSANDMEKAKRKVETEREEAYNALEVSLIDLPFEYLSKYLMKCAWNYSPL